MKSLKISAALLFTVLIFVGCERTSPRREYMPDMYNSTALKAQAEDAHSQDGAVARIPPEGTVSRNYEVYKYGVNENERAGRELKNPLPRTKQTFDRGRKMYETYCIVCHGPRGEGDGYVVPPYPRPPSLLSDKVRKWQDGNIFHVITRGQNLMPSYASQVSAEDRWMIIHYLRAMQHADNPTSGDTK